MKKEPLISAEDCMNALREKTSELGRLPIRHDFPSEEATRIRNKLGPWSRALEAAGVKEVPESRIAKLERKAAKRRRRHRGGRSRAPE